MSEVTYHVLWARFKRQDMYLLWIAGLEKEYFWTFDNQRVPAFRSRDKIIALAREQGLPLKTEQPQLHDLDSVAAWMDNPEKMPPANSLIVWNAFSDLGQSIGKPFDGDTKAPVRNRVFELLYATDGIWQRLGYRSIPAVWPRQERKVLRRILLQGFRLWRKHVYWAD
ncbi:hypothetical protein [Hymenobacter ruricola]|uniref:Uncharacterized protein n=1 Tax=Hymenobacter ruricola TaxID=2791023 RepID=A0ABS0I215_9BACT|nr:hypothetical protein [Hymenobacter ruricola]MBF9220991.1 hypothetical protein [Hymenobacter ruricola]